MEDSRSRPGCSKLTLFARFLEKVFMRTPVGNIDRTRSTLIEATRGSKKRNFFVAGFWICELRVVRGLIFSRPDPGRSVKFDQKQHLCGIFKLENKIHSFTHLDIPAYHLLGVYFTQNVKSQIKLLSQMLDIQQSIRYRQ
jgi:hypothetical protein